MKKVKRINILRCVLLILGNVIMCVIAFFAMTGLPKLGFSVKNAMYISVMAIVIFGILSYSGIEAIIKRLVMDVLFDETENSLKKHNIDCELELISRKEDGIIIFEHEFNFDTEETPDIAIIQQFIEEDLSPICTQISRMFRMEATYTVFVPDENAPE